MLVKDLMVKNVATISPLATIREAMQEMKRHRVKSLVVDKQHAHDAYGIITYTTILRTIVAEEGDIDLINVYDVCSKPVITVPAEMEVKHVARLMVLQRIRRIVVLNDNELAGLVTMNDIVSAIVDMSEH
ncbi:histidine kinase [Ectothiorhodospira haloalkaliphila]|uniref:Histidine kinase n=1 Tax=Ectothiorhodospira haloalkaliphila TaxID=421628 RepID=W8KJ98_9GAMM|nr:MULTISPECIES: CBS domain-containing protein [Ectothiorhodospira]AHK79869.1 histidine kinase [Ectothiorhodospira haloalkaliphila]MCG5493298.1 CBS domain-containing protein [Ectothiorhodospira variabilis]MCG5496642.1 CBS domain-containing protein [Ectothiorhodospira variabilis]MCG5502627.1 CBS domain-containing protein [Ectothiorhodospira variabilis]MCG5505607.1 CBS domain-containing protein [Ectothiorhodospira variabilis]